jgi:hypothetical protein
MARIELVPDDSWNGELGELHPKVVDRTNGWAVRWCAVAEAVVRCGSGVAQAAVARRFDFDVGPCERQVQPGSDDACLGVLS